MKIYMVSLFHRATINKIISDKAKRHHNTVEAIKQRKLNC